MTERHFVVLGNGPAGNRAARTLREKAPGDRVTVQFTPYDLNRGRIIHRKK